MSINEVARRFSSSLYKEGHLLIMRSSKRSIFIQVESEECPLKVESVVVGSKTSVREGFLQVVFLKLCISCTPPFL